MNIQADHFQLLGMDARFAIDAAALDAAYRALQAQVHPDRFAAAADADKRVAMQWSLRANEAYKTLRDPLKRAAYLCELNGAAIHAHDNTAMPAEFLMQQMQWRESLEEAHTEAEIAALDSQVLAARRSALARLQTLLDGECNYAAAAQEVRALMFIDKFADEVAQAAERQFS
jgi:molecular chaperone HscB